MQPAEIPDDGAGDVLLYCGLGMLMLGLIVTVVGLGDRGFKSRELRMVGPVTILCGSLLTLLRILICMIPCWTESDQREGGENVVAGADTEEDRVRLLQEENMQRITTCSLSERNF